MDRYKMLRNVILDQYKRYRQIETPDLYKLLHQVHFGAKHLLDDRAAALSRLEEEWQNPGKLRAGEALLDQIDPEGIVCRVNLRVYRKIGGSAETLWRITCESAEGHVPTPDQFHEDWQLMIQMAEYRVIPADGEQLQTFWKQVEDTFPVLHHSERYIDANEPVYRVVLTQKWLSESSAPGRGAG